MIVDLQSMLAKTCLQHASKEVEANKQDSHRSKPRPFLKSQPKQVAPHPQAPSALFPERPSKGVENFYPFMIQQQSSHHDS